MDTPTQPLSSKLTKFLINRNFGLLWIGQTISIVGDFFFDTTLVLWITIVLARNQVWLPLAVSGVALAASVPSLLVGPLAGVFVDRWEKRHTMLWMDASRAILVLLLLITTGLLPLPFGINSYLPVAWRLGCIYVAVVLQTCCAQFFDPARMTMIADIVPDTERARGMSMNTIAYNIGLLVAPALAAPLFLSFGVVWAILIDALSFIISFGCILLIQVPQITHSVNQKGKSNYFREFVSGLHFFRENRVLIVLLVAGIFFNLGTGAFNALYLLFVLNDAHTPVELAGLFTSSYGVAVILGSMVAVVLAKRIGEGRLFWLALMVWGILLLLFAHMTNFLAALFLNCMLGFSNAGINVVVGPLLMRFTHREYMGRVSAIFSPVIQAAQFFSIIVAGFLASTLLKGLHTSIYEVKVGPIDTIFTGAGLLAILAGTYASIALHGVDMNPHKT
ncbi:MFS transporter [Dictyobacter aurantiacus]|uniref:MFS transporter n=1 Tax=Dictyobacter aurantiacus TaxID=1936993 RepID=A0A401ZK29_9CHLR|nr:MFS transporter [Dictyobacter aurantiacus]GCE07199.1 MFS transporter [Dictyobacter aurantiacus]